MKGNDNKHILAFRNGKLKPQETILGHLEGWIGEMMGSGENTQHNGQFVLTNERACFYRKGFLGEVLQTIPVAKITSVETLSRMGYRVLRLHTSHDDLAFKTFEEVGLFEKVHQDLETLRQPVPVAPAAPSASAPIDHLAILAKLGELQAIGVITKDEFEAKKAEILSRL